jgi:hypothetical protein
VSSKPPADLLSRHIWAGGEKFFAFDQFTIANMRKNNGGTNNWNYVKETYRGEDYVIPGGIIGTLFKRGHSTIVTP